jgi:hypothetical protein
MPILSTQGESDARVAAWLLATTAVDCLQNPALASTSEVALNNVYHLLEAARLNPFFGFEPKRGVAERAEGVFLAPARERHVGEVRSALEAAIADHFGGRPREEALAALETVLRQVTYPTQFGQATEADRVQARQFFDAVRRRLKRV